MSELTRNLLNILLCLVIGTVFGLAIVLWIR